MYAESSKGSGFGRLMASRLSLIKAEAVVVKGVLNGLTGFVLGILIRPFSMFQITVFCTRLARN